MITPSEYKKQRDNLLKVVAKYNHVDCGDDQCGFLIEGQQAIDALVLSVIGEDVKDYGRCVVRNDDGTIHSSSAGSYRDYCNNELKATQRAVIHGGEEEKDES